MANYSSARSGFQLAVSIAAALAAAASARAGDVSVKLDSGAGFSVRNSTGATERLRVDEATGNVSRNGALFVHTTGASNLFVGESAGNPGATGSGGNAAFGAAALNALTTGFSNTAAGSFALLNNTSGNANSAVGRGALAFNTTGGGNSALGSFALYFNQTGSFNAGLGFAPLFSNTTGTNNVAVGYSALRQNTTGNSNSAVGTNALRYNTTASFNSAFGDGALRTNTTGYDNTAVGRSALSANTYGAFNTAVGSRALSSNIGGYWNTAVGSRALYANTSYTCCNTAIGSYALSSDTTGHGNTATGVDALTRTTTGRFNTATGYGAMRDNVTGISNTATGRLALFHNTGSRNLAFGEYAGFNQTTGNDNIYLANTGVAGENQQIKIGTVGTHTQTTIAGISGATSSGGVAVLVNASGVLGTTTSSARFKQDVRDMGEASDVLMKLRPVTFRYREDAVGPEDAKQTQYGLIAEEVAEVAPELVAQDLEGKPYSVKYHELPALLLNEVKEQHRINEEQKQVISMLEERLEHLEREGMSSGSCEAR